MGIYDYTVRNNKGEAVFISVYCGKVHACYFPVAVPEKIEGEIEPLLWS